MKIEYKIQNCQEKGLNEVEVIKRLGQNEIKIHLVQLLKAELVEKDGIIIDPTSEVNGAGRAGQRGKYIHSNLVTFLSINLILNIDNKARLFNINDRSIDVEEEPRR